MLKIITISVLFLFAGCNEEKFSVKTKEYYLKNPEIAKTRVDECNKTGVSSENEKIDCTNAKLAINQIIIKSNSPIIGDEVKKSKW